MGDASYDNREDKTSCTRYRVGECVLGICLTLCTCTNMYMHGDDICKLPYSMTVHAAASI